MIEKLRNLKSLILVVLMALFGIWLSAQVSKAGGIGDIFQDVFQSVSESTSGAYKAPAGTTSHQKDTMRFLVPLVAKWEGLRTKAYQDIVGVWTICYGHTKNVSPGDTMTEAQCQALLEEELVVYYTRILPAFTEQSKKEHLPPTRYTAFTDLAYNVGIGGTKTSTAVKRLNAGNIEGACEAIGWYNRAGKKVIRGLVLRRQDDIAYCMMGT